MIQMAFTPLHEIPDVLISIITHYVLTPKFSETAEYTETTIG